MDSYCLGLNVVHVKWSNCPAGDHNRAKGKESYPSLAFECITDFDRRILGVFGPLEIPAPTTLQPLIIKEKLNISKP